MRGSGGFTSDERPKNYRQAIALLFPNGDAPLTAILSMLAEEATDDAEFAWFEKGLPIQRGQITGASTDHTATVTDSSDIGVGSEAAQGTVGIMVRADGGTDTDLSWVKAGSLLLNENTEEVFYVAQVIPGAHGTARLVVRRDVGNKFASDPAITADIGTAGDFVTIVGSGFPEGAPIGSAVAYRPAKYHNFTQIYRTPLFLTRTARKTRLRYDAEGPIREAKREALQIHAIEMERSFIWGEREEISALTAVTLPAEVTPSSEQLLRTTRGIVQWLPTIDTTGSPDSVHHDIGTSNGGVLTEVDFDAWLEQVFRHGSAEKLAFAGGTALNVLNQMAKNKMTIEAVPTDQSYGLALNRIVTPYGTLLLKQHPLMSHNPTWRKDLIVIDTAHVKFRYIDDTRYLKNRQSPGDDATKDEFLTEAGLEVHFGGRTPDSGDGSPPSAHGRLKGIASFGG
jgi:hypothetical protein